tara:strand:- start:123 stop:878 length:756 start_codon:yes stop_codon:yes gene_type:complete
MVNGLIKNKIKMKRTTFILIFSVFLSNTITSQTNINRQGSNPKEDNLGSWLMYFGTHHLNEKLSIHYETQLRTYETSSNFFQLLPRAGLNYKIDDNSMVTAGYALIPTQKGFDEGWGNDMEIENRIWQQFILRNKVGNVSIRHRYRLEQRWIEKNDTTTYKNRARYMLSLKIPLSKNKDFPLFLSFYDEIFLNLSETPFDQNRLFGAIGFQLNKNMNIQAGYLRHRAGELDLDRLQLALFLNTGNKTRKEE